MKNKFFSFINVIGLSIGLTCFLLIGVFVANELSYDKYPDNAQNIYRVNLSATGNGNVVVYPYVDNAVGAGMKNTFPEIKDFTRVSSPKTDFVKYGDKEFKEEKIAFADSNFLQFFSIPLIEGNNNDALVQPNSIVITKAFAHKYFGEAEPLGKLLIVGLKNAAYTVTGVIDKVPDNSHFHFDAFISYSTFPVPKPSWSNLGYYTYILLNKNADPGKLEAKFPQLVENYVVPEIVKDMGVSLAEAKKTIKTIAFSLQPLTDIHLHSHTKYEIEPNGDMQYVYIFSALAVFILLLACINFTNLSIARSIKRAKEVGVRKVMGSLKFQLIKQFLSESVLMSFCAMLIALLLIFLLLPYYNILSGKTISFASLFNYRFFSALLAIVLIVGILSGIYPSFFLSSFNPINAFKGAALKTGKKASLRNVLIVFQFFVSTALVTATIIIYTQLNYLQNKKLGYDKDQVLFIPDARLLGDNQEAFKQELLRDNRVVAATISRSVPGDPYMGGTQIYPKNDNGNVLDIHTNIYNVDYDYIRTLGIQIKEGRFFSRDFQTDSASGVVINEAAANELGWSHVDPVGKTIMRSGLPPLTVIGVVRDFNYTSAKQAVAPLMMLLGRNSGGLIIKIKTADIAGFLNSLKKSWNNFSPAGALSYNFLDDKFAQLYTSEIRTRKIFSVFAVVAIIIAALGLLGLSAFVIEQRTKEIGIRKVLGASVQNVLLLMSKEFLSLVLIAFIISIPVTWWAMHTWLEDYAYRVNIAWWFFAVAGATAILIASVSVTFQAVKAATANPVKSLRTE